MISLMYVHSYLSGMKSEFHFIEAFSLLLRCLHIKLAVDIHGVIIYFAVHHVLLCSKWENICDYDCPINSGYIYIYVFAFVLKHFKRASPCQDLILNSVEMSVKCMY